MSRLWCGLTAEPCIKAGEPASDGIVRPMPVKILKQIAVFTGLLEEVENIGTAEQISPSKRRFVSGKKRIGRLTRLILLVTPYRIQYALGYRAEESIGKTTVDDIRKSPLKPCGKGSKRKQDDLDMEEQLSWVAALASEDLPYEDQDDDPTYEGYGAHIAICYVG
ncbi:unnamed protein product [Ranitomeya imitator]|uniref:Uncharacterized protein n=1 Tax=Ranitomeya imitator TaxID=111125 RepID=A0ABN9LI22_9NEOB|nr:unnamed protein product [Ranitomeya imitator]